MFHSNAGLQGKRNIGTKNSLIRGLSRERFGWLYARMRELVHATNAGQWRFASLGEISDSLQIGTYQASAGGKYDWHVDQNLWGAATHNRRIISVTVQLSPAPSEPEAAGGRLFVGGEPVPMARGSAAIFPSYMPHRVEAVRQVSPNVRPSKTVWE